LKQAFPEGYSLGWRDSESELMISTRIAQVKDADSISRVLAASWKSAYRGIVGDDYLNALKENHWVDFLTSELNGDKIFSMVLLENQTIIGASVLGKSENENEIHLISLYLLPEKIGQGLGHTFYNEIEKEIRARGFSKCVLDVLASNTRAIRFYEANGFLDTHRNATVQLGGQDYSYMVFEKDLGAVGNAHYNI